MITDQLSLRDSSNTINGNSNDTPEKSPSSQRKAIDSKMTPQNRKQIDHIKKIALEAHKNPESANNSLVLKKISKVRSVVEVDDVESLTDRFESMALKPTLSFDDISGVIGKDVKEFCDVNFIKKLKKLRVKLFTPSTQPSSSDDISMLSSCLLFSNNYMLMKFEELKYEMNNIKMMKSKEEVTVVKSLDDLPFNFNSLSKLYVIDGPEPFKKNVKINNMLVEFRPTGNRLASKINALLRHLLLNAFMKKVHEVRPDFEGALAYIDQYGRQAIISSDRDLRDALTQTKNKLKLHTTLAEGAVISAAEIAGRPTRSQSVPPERAYHSYPPANSRSPSSMDSAPATYRNRVASPPPASHHSQPMQVKTHYTYGSSGYSQASPGAYSYGPYSQSLLYGMPPHNGMLLRFLANPFPFGHYNRTFIGPNKYHFGAGGWGARYGTGFGPIW